MAITDEQQLDIINVCSGFFNAAPGQTFLNEFIAAVEAGATIEQLADAFAASSVFTDTILGGETSTSAIVNVLMNNYGLTPGNSDPDSADAIAEAFFTASLEAGVDVSDIIIQAVNFLKGTVDPAFVATQMLFNNKAAVAAAYSAVNSSTDIDELQGLYDGLTGDALLTEDEIDNIVNPPAEFTLTSGIAAIEAAEAALSAFLLEAGQDPDVAGEEAPLTEVQIADALATAITDVDDEVNGDYTGASTNVRAAMISDQEAANAAALTTAEDALSNAMAAVAEVAGLTDAVAALAVADEADQAATLNANLVFNNEYGAARITYNASADSDVASDGTGETLRDDLPQHDGFNLPQIIEGISDGDDDLIVINGDELALGVGITESTHPGVTALLEAAASYNTAAFAALDAFDAAVRAQQIVENLDLNADRAAALEAVGDEFTSTTPANPAKPTIPEIEAEGENLFALQQNAHAAAVAAGLNSFAEAFDTLQTAITNAADDTDAIADLTADAASAGYITAADKAAIDAGADSAEANAALAANNPQQRMDDFNDAVEAYENANGGTPLLDAQQAAETAVENAQNDVDALTEAVAAQATAQENVDTLAALNTDITNALNAFSDEGLETPVALDGANASATSADDIFYIGDSTETDITGFGLLGSDSLVIGTDFTLNADTVAGADGDNNVMEVWITETGSDTLVTLETSTFGSNARTPEVAEITLVGVDAADVMLTDGIITIA